MILIFESILQVISPMFEALSNQVRGIKFYKVDCDEAPSISNEAGVRAMPTFVVFRNGQKVDSVVGARPALLEVSFVHSDLARHRNEGLGMFVDLLNLDTGQAARCRRLKVHG